MDYNKFFDLIIKDPPFSYPEPDEKSKSVLVGSNAEKFMGAFKKVYHGCMQGSMMTTVIGPPRSGKSQFIYNFEYNVNENNYSNSIVIVLKPSGEPFGEQYLLKKIISNTLIYQKLKEFEIDVPEKFDDRDQVIIAINVLIKNLQNKYGITSGICLSVDNVDEQIRLMKGSSTDVVKKDIQKFLGVFRTLIGDINKGLCVLFALTEDAYRDFNSAFEDQTLRGRFSIIFDINGVEMQLGDFTENEACILISTYMKNWLERQNNQDIQSLPQHKDCIVDGMNLFPFSKDAVSYFWRAGIYPGFISYACKQSLIEKYYNFQNSEVNPDPIIGISDAAVVLQTYSSEFPGIENIKDELKLIINIPQIEDNLNKSVNDAKLKYGLCFNKVEEIFGFFLKSLEPSINIEEIKMPIISLYNHENILDLIIKYQEKIIGISFVNSLNVTKKNVISLAAALKQGKITHGIIYCIPNTDDAGEPEFNTKSGHDALLEFRNLIKGIDYRPVKILRKIDVDNAWKIIGIVDLQGDDIKTQYANYLNEKLQILQDFQNLIRSEPVYENKISRPKTEYIP